MRGLSKLWPPRDVSPDGQAPRRFVDAEREYLTAIPGSANKTRFARTEFERLDKSKLRKVMSGEQASLCVYCEHRALGERPAGYGARHKNSNARMCSVIRLRILPAGEPPSAQRTRFRRRPRCTLVPGTERARCSCRR